MLELHPQHVVRAGLITILLVYLQVSVISQFDIAGVKPELLMLFVIAIGLEGGQERGALAGFACGLVFDIFVETPFGLTALVLCLLGFVAGGLWGRLMRSPWWLNPLLAFIGTGVGVILWASVGTVFGQDGLFAVSAVRIAFVAGLVNAVACPVLVRIVRWALAPQLADVRR